MIASKGVHSKIKVNSLFYLIPLRLIAVICHALKRVALGKYSDSYRLKCGRKNYRIYLCSCKSKVANGFYSLGYLTVGKALNKSIRCLIDKAVALRLVCLVRLINGNSRKCRANECRGIDSCYSRGDVKCFYISPCKRKTSDSSYVISNNRVL